MPLTKELYNLNNPNDVEELRRYLQDNDDEINESESSDDGLNEAESTRMNEENEEMDIATDEEVRDSSDTDQSDDEKAKTRYDMLELEEN
ncbi:hypothetical protein FQR65_LT19094 [Abscondita terminalis]|nr:hypothetical protein FQR65_LT19094 [Abscondita terminalis]